MASPRVDRQAATPDRRAPAKPVARTPVVAPAAHAAQALQRRLGNQGAGLLVARATNVAPPAQIHAKEAPGKPQAAGLQVSSPGDPSEREATSVASAIMRMPVAAPSVADGGAAPSVQRSPAAAAPSPSSLAGGVHVPVSGGMQLPSGVRGFMEPRFGADFSRVQIHTGEHAATMSQQLNAKAFTVGNNVFFGRGEYKPDTNAGRELIAHELTHTIQQRAAVQRSEGVRVAEQAPIGTQRLGIGDALDFFAREANHIPGFRMFTIILGVNPINMSQVDRSPANILRALVEFLPGGHLIVQALESSGIFERVGGWVAQQIASLGLVGASIKAAVTSFLGTLKWSDVFNLSGVWERAKAIFTAPITRIINFAKGLVAGIIAFVKEAILMPVARLASQTRGWDLLIAVLGRNPITGEPVPRNADTLIGGFLKLIGQQEVWENMKRANAIPRAWAWFQGALGAVVGFVAQIPTLAMNAFRSLEIADIVLVPRAFAKIAGVFGGFIGNFISWAGGAVWNLLEIVFESISPKALAYIKRTGAALRSILRNPIPFVGNLVRAAKLGFQNFGTNFLTHLKSGLINWLTGAMPGVYIPQAFTLGEIVKFVFSVLGISWQNIRQKLVKVMGEPAVKAMETGFDIVVTLVTQGPAAAWEKIKEQLGNLKDMVIGGITDFVVDTVVKKAIPKLLSMFIPGAGFISAIMSIYDTVMVFVNKLTQIGQVVMGFVDSIVAIAGGAIGAAANKVEQSLAGILSLAINFLAGFVGLGDVAQKVMGVIGKVRVTVDKALDALVNWIVTAARRLGRFVAQAGVPSAPAERLRLARSAALAAVGRFAGRPVAAAVLGPLMSAIRIRYGLTRLEVLPVDRRWQIVGAINPDFSAATDSFVPGSAESDRTLLVGEGDFSFGLSIAVETQIGGRLVATDYVVQERQTMKLLPANRAKEERFAQDVRSNVAKLKAMGVEVGRQVDATDAASYPSGDFAKIIFNHPFVLTRDEAGLGIRGAEGENRLLVERFLGAAKQKLREDGEIVIISSRMLLARWRIDQVAEQLGLETRVMKFLASEFPGYMHQRTDRPGSAGSVTKSLQFAVVFKRKR